MRTLPLTALTLAGLLPAQQLPYVSPAHFTGAEGGSNNVYPFGATQTPFRYQQIHDDVPTMVISGIQFRNNVTPAGTQFAAFDVTIDAWISTATVPSASAGATFDLNHGVDKIQCVTNRTITIPANDPSAIPHPWTLDIPFDPSVVFAFAGAPASLCWEVQLTARTNTVNTPLDAVSGAGTTNVNPTLQSSRWGTGCRATGQTQPMLATQTNTSMNWPASTGAFSVSASQLQSNGFFVWVNGLDTTVWSGIPLPAVIPTSTGAPSGTCTLYTDLFFLTVAQASGSGAATLSLQYAATPVLHGFRVYTQVLGLDAAANPFGLTTSNAAVQQIIAPYTVPFPVARIFLLGSLGATGTVGTDYGLVTRFY